MLSPGAAETAACPLCGERVATDECVLTDAHGPFHRSCWLRVSRVTLTLARLIRSTLPRGVCHVCLAARLGIDEGLARIAAWRLRANPEFLVGLGECAGCGLRRVTTRARRPRSGSSRRPADGGHAGRALGTFGVPVEGRVCLALAGPGLLDAPALADATGALLDRDALRVYVLDFDGVAVDAAMRADPRVVIVPPVTPIGDLQALPERTSLAVVDLRFGTVKEGVPAITRMLDRGAEAILRVRLDTLAASAPDQDREYSGIRCRVAVLGAARAATQAGWHVAGVAPASASGPCASAFLLHLTGEPRDADIDAMIAETVEGLA